MRKNRIRDAGTMRDMPASQDRARLQSAIAVYKRHAQPSYDGSAETLTGTTNMPQFSSLLEGLTLATMTLVSVVMYAIGASVLLR